MHQSSFPETRDSFGAGRFVALAIVVVLAVSTIAGGAVSAQATNGSNITTDADGSPLVVSNQSRDFTTHSRASVQFNDQRVRPLPNSSTYSNKTTAVVIDRVTVPNGGFISIVGKQALQKHGLDSYEDYEEIGFGNSSYLSSGTHRNVTVGLFDTTPTHPGEVVAVLHNDVDGDHMYEALLPDEERNDTEYLTRKNGSVVIANDTATIYPPDGQATTSNTTGALAPPLAEDTGTTPTSTIGEETPTETSRAEGGDGNSGVAEEDETSGGLLGGNPILLVVIGLLVGGGVVALLGKMRRD